MKKLNISNKHLKIKLKKNYVEKSIFLNIILWRLSHMLAILIVILFEFRHSYTLTVITLFYTISFM